MVLKKWFRKAGLLMLGTVLLASVSVTGASAKSNTSNLVTVDASQYINKNVAKKAQKSKYKTAEDVYKAHGVSTGSLDLEKLPAGTGMIKVNSLEELDALLSSVEANVQTALNQEAKPVVTTAGTGMMTAAAQSVGTWYTTMYDAKTPNCSYSSYKIDACTASTGLNGFTLGVSWTQSAANSVKISDTRWYSSGSGTVALNIFFQGIGQIASSYVTGNHYVNI